MFERIYKPGSNFVYVRLSSDVDDKQLMDHIAAYNREAEGKTGLLELCDTRQATSYEGLTVDGCKMGGKLDIGKPRVAGGKLAFLVTNKMQFGLARVFSTFASESGREIGIFEEIDKAVEFLNPEESLTEILSFIENS
ncbi:MAG: hypothetical protein JXR97_04300 [Planctomycetes bacterium]|nr:hypothetical protein [Planctomycetota bacterium]